MLSIEKVERIAKNDPEYLDTTDDALQAVATATELFVQVLTAESLTSSLRVQQQYYELYNAMQNGSSELTLDLELRYEDLADCIAQSENLQFLADVIPRTKRLGDLVNENKVRYRDNGSQ